MHHCSDIVVTDSSCSGSKFTLGTRILGGFRRAQHLKAVGRRTAIRRTGAEAGWRLNSQQQSDTNSFASNKHQQLREEREGYAG